MRLIAAISFLLLILPIDSYGATSYVICAKRSNGALSVRTRCASSHRKVSNLSSLVGATGANGADGNDGAVRVYGNGSAGSLTITEATSLSSVNNQYTDITIIAGQTLTVPSGTTLRCTGTFLNNGTIVVSPAGYGGLIRAYGGTAPSLIASTLASKGLSEHPAENGDVGTSSGDIWFGYGGRPVTTAFAKNLLIPHPFAGGAGGGTFATSGGSGGGSLRIACQGAMYNAGTIAADGQGTASAAGGGAGGLIILASGEQVTNTGSISVNGGVGGNSVGGGDHAASGGGGGGVVHLISPIAPVTGTITATGGAGGTAGGSVTSSPRGAGAGGGSFYGTGGSGSYVTTDNSTGGGSAGTDGMSFSTTADPLSLMIN